jgi:hemerythrin
MTIDWTPDLDTGIGVIDDQHRRIVDFINDLEVAQVMKNPKQIRRVIDDCVDYTLSHFAFEESLQEEAGYPYCKPHKKVHELFTRRVSEYQERLDLGDDVSEELHAMLSRWLVNHIKRDDADYVGVIRANRANLIKEQEEAPEAAGWFRRFFKKS